MSSLGRRLLHRSHSQIVVVIRQVSMFFGHFQGIFLPKSRRFYFANNSLATEESITAHKCVWI